jgi:hypothetical protein
VEGDEEGREWLRDYLRRKQATWPNAPTHPQWYSEPFEEYNVRYLPFNLLLDPEGRVIDADVRGWNLDQVVARAIDAAEGATTGEHVPNAESSRSTREPVRGPR